MTYIGLMRILLSSSCRKDCKPAIPCGSEILSFAIFVAEELLCHLKILCADSRRPKYTVILLPWSICKREAFHCEKSLTASIEKNKNTPI